MVSRPAYVEQATPDEDIGSPANVSKMTSTKNNNDMTIKSLGILTETGSYFMCV